MKRIFGKKGFTLLELLVVISIIGLLIAIGAVAFTTAQKKGRDARRRADIKGYQSAFEQYYAENNTYGTCANMITDNFAGGEPTDPKTGTAYSVVTNCSTTAYCVCATLDFPGAGNATSNSSTTSCAFGSGVGADYFCVTNLQ